MNTNTEEVIELAPLSQLKTTEQGEDHEQEGQMQGDNMDLSAIMSAMLSQLKVKEQDGEEVQDGEGHGQGGIGDFSAIMSAMMSQLKTKEGEEGQAQEQGDLSAIMSSMLSQLKTKGGEVQEQEGGEEQVQKEKGEEVQEGQGLGDAKQIPRLTLGDININDILAKLMGNIDFNNDETLDSDYLVTGDGDDGDCEGVEEVEGVEGDGEGDIIEEADLKAMFENFNDANLMNNFKSMIELLSKKMPVSTVSKEEETSHMENVD
jgi:hypothetical protein